MVTYTRHGKVRSQQRGIPPLVISWLMEFGRVTRHKGADVYYLDHCGRKRLRRHIGRRIYNRLVEFLDAYAVVSDDGEVITVGWHYTHFNI